MLCLTHSSVLIMVIFSFVIFMDKVISGCNILFRFMVPYLVIITLNKNANQMYFVLKILKILFTFRSTCFGHHCVHHQELLSCTCSLWSRVVLGSLCPPVLLCCNSYTGPETACAAEKLLMMDAVVSETCRAEQCK